MRPMIYIAGPLTVGGVSANVHQAMDINDRLIRLGFATFCPHLSHFQDMMFPGIDYEEWIQYDLSIVERCDYLLRIPGPSKGADREVVHAQEHGVKVVYSINELPDLSKEEAI